MKIMHLVTQRNQPYGSRRKCCERCGLWIQSSKWGDDDFGVDDESDYTKEYAHKEGAVRCVDVDDVGTDVDNRTAINTDIDYATFQAETRQHIALVADLLMTIAMKLLNRSLHHDDSKLLEPERTPLATVTPKLHSLTYGSEEYKSGCRELGDALQHHYEHNRHHAEFYKHGILDMNLVDLIEMVCDWYAATKRHDDGNFATSIGINQKRFGIPLELIAIIANTEDMMREATTL